MHLTTNDYIELLDDIDLCPDTKLVLEVVSKVGGYFQDNISRFSTDQRSMITNQLGFLQYKHKMAANRKKLEKDEVRKSISEAVGVKKSDKIDLGYSIKDNCYSMHFKKYQFSL